MTRPGPRALAELVADTVAAHPSVVRLDSGTFGAVATWLPGHRLVGVHVGGPGEPVEIGVVLTLDRPIPAVVAALRRSLAPLVDGVPVDVTVADVAVDDVPVDDVTVDDPAVRGPHGTGVPTA